MLHDAISAQGDPSLLPILQAMADHAPQQVLIVTGSSLADAGGVAAWEPVIQELQTRHQQRMKQDLDNDVADPDASKTAFQLHVLLLGQDDWDWDHIARMGGGQYNWHPVSRIEGWYQAVAE